MKRCVIIGGAPIHDYHTARSYLTGKETAVFCDSGLLHREGLGVVPDLVIGDFDSHDNPHLSAETIVLPREKDDTDTMFAVKEMVRRGYDEFVLLGVIGKRLDHTLGNLSALLYLTKHKKSALAVDDYSEIQVVGRETVTIDDGFSYFSLLCTDGPASGIRIQNAKYPLENASMDGTDPYGISNEVLPQKKACVSVARGHLLLVKVRSDR